MSSLLGAHNAIGRFMAQRKSSSTTSRISTHGAARSYYSSATAQSDLGSVQQSILNANANKRVTLGTLKPAEGSHKTERRIGRGIGSGRGKTSTYGHKGRTARQGGEVAFGFEGGQTPMYKRMRKFGFTNKAHKIEYAPLNLSRLQFWIDTGRIDATQMITMKTLVDSGCVGRLRKLQRGVKLLGDGHEWFKTPINVEVSQASSSALNAIKQTGGDVKLVYYNQTGLRALLKPEKFHPHTSRPLPYLTIPRANINRKLLHPMEQPEQFQGWTEAQNALREAIQASTGSNNSQSL